MNSSARIIFCILLPAIIGSSASVLISRAWGHELSQPTVAIGFLLNIVCATGVTVGLELWKLR